MGRTWCIVALFTCMGLASVGCQDQGLKSENVELRQENRNLQSRLSDTEGRLKQAPDPSQLSAMQQEIAARDAKIADLQNQLRAPAPGQPSNGGLEGIEVTHDDAAGTVTVNLPGDVLFDSGQDQLKPSAIATLNKVVAALKKDYSGKKIMVDGYTDTDPISRTRDKWQDNLDLSAARARSVSKFLVQQGFEQRLIGTRAFGDTKPRNTKPASRRVELVVMAR